jgi:2-hydroxycyclohexanecarboxyl-CoA dehydrogenase
MTQHIRTALVTGGGAGMGRATCLRLARDGRAVAVLDIDRKAAESAAQSIVEAGGRAVAVAADIADRSQLEAAVGIVRNVLGPITILINNAAVENFSPFQEINGDLWDRLMEVNLKGT